MTTDLPTTTTPAPAPVKDNGTESLLKKGDRVVIRQRYSNDSDLNGRHGTIERVETVGWRTMTLGLGAMPDGPTSVERHHYYFVKTDAGYRTSSMSYEDLVPETEPAPATIPDPIDAEGKHTTLGILCRGIEYAHSSYTSSKAKAARARVAKSINQANEAAARYQKEKNESIARLEEWCAKYPEGLTQNLKTIEATMRKIGMLSTPRADAAGPGSETPSARMTENEARDGVELRFDGKPSEDVLRMLKANGWRWARGSRCWYARRNADTLAFARAMAGEPVAA